ncbi:MAG: hypothetical protein IPP77_02375 [Bacteroidetes bacterium]|nr:hypothetical protein [Bacteroidota bacterium]
MQDDKPDKAEEPAADYSKKRLTFFNSFEEEQEAQISYWRGLKPIERMEQLRSITLYAFSHYEKYTGNRLTFD